MKGKKQVADFREGKHVEVARDAKGFRDSWFSAKILKLPNANSKKPKIVVQYKKLLAKENEKAHLKESVDPSLVRPIPPPQARDQSFQLHQCVDALCNQGWWKGEIVEILENGKYTVHFPAWNEFTEFKAAQLRAHMDWIDGKWVTPQAKKEDRIQKDVAHTSLKRKWQINQCSTRPNSKLLMVIGESSSPAIATRTTTSSIKAREALHQTISETRDTLEETPGREVVNVVKPEFPLEGAQLQISSNTDDAPHPVFCLPDNPQSMDFDMNASTNRKRKAKRGRGRPSKKVRNEELPGCSLTDSIRTIPGRTVTKLESFTILDGQEALLQQKKGASQDSTDHPTPSPRYPQSLLDSRLSDGVQGYEINQQEGDQLTGTTTRSLSEAMVLVPAEAFPPEGSEQEILSKRGRGKPSKKLCIKEAPGGSLTDPTRTMPGRTAIKRGRGRPSKKLYNEEAPGGSLPDPIRTMPGRTATKRGRGRPSKKLYNVEAPGGSLIDPIRTIPCRTTTELESSAILDGAQGYDINQQKGGVETTKESEAVLLEAVEDFTYETPNREVVALQTDIMDVAPLSMCRTESFLHASAGEVPHNQVASKSNMESTSAETSLKDEAISEDGKMSFAKSLSPVWGWLKKLVRRRGNS